MAIRLSDYYDGNYSNFKNTVKDDKEVLDFFENNKNKTDEELAKAYTTNTEFWGENLDEIAGFTDAVIENIKTIKELGTREAMKKVLINE